MENGNGNVMTGGNLAICTALLQTEWSIRYEKKFGFEYKYDPEDSDRIKEIVMTWGYDRTFVSLIGAIRFYDARWKSQKFKWLSINQIYTWIGDEIWQMYLEKEFRIQIIRPKI